LSPPILVEDGEGLARLVRELEGAREVAVDTEADSFYRYREQVCLIQLTVGELDFLVDPLRDLDLSGLGRLFADPERLKVFHDGEYDVLILRRDYDFTFRNLFDTRIAAMALGDSMPGLASVVRARFGIELDKSQQRSDWSRRPLTDRQIRYARLDTRYLIPLMAEMKAALEERGRTMIVEQECRRLEGLEAPRREFLPDEFVRLKGARKLNLRQARLLRVLYEKRDDLARTRDVPPFKVLGNGVLVAIAQSLPRSHEELGAVDGLSPKLVRRLGVDLMAAVRRAERLGPLTEMPRLPARDGTGRLDDEAYELHERLKSWRKTRGQAEGLDSSLVLNRHALLQLAVRRPSDAAQLAEMDGILPWQAEAFGDELLGAVAEFEDDLAAGRIELPTRGRARGRRRRPT